MKNTSRIKGSLLVELFGPGGHLLEQFEVPNLITSTGDAYYASRGGGVTTGLGAPLTGMKLGTGTAAPTKSAGTATLTSYFAASQVALSSTTVVDKAGTDDGYRITYVASWGPGVATTSGLSEVVLTNQTPLTDAAPTVANTIARALLNPVVNKGANDTLQVTWHHDFLGS